ncbi:CNNM domain-containing protein [Botrimarina sp.]|uniref:CNNM domain-containing protein n=1 Tax=Botrimarina sp. TaxID=2795802 RepID=UPI0032EE90A1
MIWAVATFCVGLTLSAFFSGSETGFYRTPRLRLVIDAVGGNRTSRGLLWASNHPEAFVAAALVGNNIANYLVSSAIVAAAGVALPGAGLTGEMLLTLLLAPVVFVYGELLPKRAFLQAPYRLMRGMGGGLLLAGVVLAAPASLLWLTSRALSKLTGAKVQPLRMAVRRRELTDAFAEGQAVGLLSTAQRDLALAIFSLGALPLRDYMTPVARQERLSQASGVADVLKLARRRREDAWPVEPARNASKRHEYVRAAPLVTGATEVVREAMPVFREATPFLQALTQLESTGKPIGAVLGAGDRVTGYIRLEQLQEALWNAS